MFNRQQFNKGKFNVGSGSSLWSQVNEVYFGLVCDMTVMRPMEVEANMAIELITDMTRVMPMDASMAMEMETDLDMVRQVQSELNLPLNADLEIARFSTMQGDFIEFVHRWNGSNFDELLPGEEIIIDTDKMTVTKNGESIVDQITSASTFFQLSPGLNDLIMEGDGSGKIDIKVIWKDRWL